MDFCIYIFVFLTLTDCNYNVYEDIKYMPGYVIKSTYDQFYIDWFFFLQNLKACLFYMQI